MSEYRIRRAGRTGMYHTGTAWSSKEHAQIYPGGVKDMIPLPEAGVWEEVGETNQYRITVTIELEADDRKQAAMKAYSLLNEITPTKFTIMDTAFLSEEIELTEEETEKALNRALEGKLFLGLPRTGE